MIAGIGITANVGVSANGGGIELDLKLPGLLSPLLRKSVENKLLASASALPAGMILMRTPNGNLGFFVTGVRFDSAGCINGTIYLKAEII